MDKKCDLDNSQPIEANDLVKFPSKINKNTYMYIKKMH